MVNNIIKYAFRDERLNIFAMTYGEIPTLENKQIMICKKQKFSSDRLGPFLLDPKMSKPTYTKSSVGIKYENQLKDKEFELKYIAFIEDQIEIEPNLELFQELIVKGVFSLWGAEAPFKYFEGCERGYLVLFRVYKISEEVHSHLLEKGRNGRNYYYALSQAVNYEDPIPIMDDTIYYGIKHTLLESIKRYKGKELEDTVIYEDVIQMIKMEEVHQHVAEVSIYDRNQSVSKNVKYRANGCCECCGSKAPFVKENGEPYLEEHHLIALCEDGEDNLDNVCAVCPNCHRELHYGINREELRNKIQVYIRTNFR